MKPLIIFVTRMEGGGEWKNTWGFHESLFVTFIRGQHWTKVRVEDCTRQLFQEHLEADVWVFNGAQISQEVGIDALNQIPWRNLGREFIPLIHRGENKPIDDSEWRKRFSSGGRDNNREFFSKAIPYSGSQRARFRLIQDFALSEGTTGNEYDNALSKLYEELNIEQSPLQAIVELLQLFLPLDLQLQVNELDISGCKREATTLYDKLPKIAFLHTQITGEEITPEQLQTQPDKVDDDGATVLLQKLMGHVWRVRKSTTRDEMSAIFGIRSKAHLPNSKKAGSLDPEGFHSTYERLRDALLNLVERD